MITNGICSEFEAVKRGDKKKDTAAVAPPENTDW
jgi:hypothetical protein